MSIDPEDLKPIRRECEQCGQAFWVSATLPLRLEPKMCQRCGYGPDDEPEHVWSGGSR